MNCNVIPSDLKNICIQENPEFIELQPKSALEYTIIYIKSGNMKAEFNDSVHFLSAGQFILLDNSADRYCESLVSKDCTALFITFSLEQKLNFSIDNEIIFSNIANDSYIKSIIYEFQNKQDNYQQIILFDLASLLIFLERIAKQKSKTMSSIYDYSETKSSSSETKHSVENKRNIIDECINIINSNLENPDLNVPFLTKKLYISPAYLHTLFKKYTNLSINKYIQNCRISQATVLLKDSSFSVTEISEMLGFCSQCYFSSQFKKALDITPSEYREINNT